MNDGDPTYCAEKIGQIGRLNRKKTLEEKAACDHVQATCS